MQFNIGVAAGKMSLCGYVVVTEFLKKKLM